MSRDPSHPDFTAFTRWLAAKGHAAAGTKGSATDPARSRTLLEAARAARNEVLATRPGHSAASQVTAEGALEVLHLLAAADTSDTARPPELTTTRGFRVTLSYDEGNETRASSICVLVSSPSEMIAAVQGRTVFLWNGTERFELGQFDSEGKAIGTLPAGVEISLSDFALGRVKLEEPLPPSEE